MRKRPELGGRNPIFSNHSMNSLRSNSISYFVAQIASAIRDSIKIQKNRISLKTSSCGMFSRIYSRKHGARSVVTSSARFACRRMFSRIPFWRQAFSVVGVKTWRTPKGQRLESHTKTLMETTSRRNQLSPLPKIGEGLGEWPEAPSYEEGVGVDGGLQGVPCKKKK